MSEPIPRERVEVLMKRCLIGYGGPAALENCHDLLAELYGVLGRLLAERDLLSARQYQRGLRMEVLRDRLLALGAWHQFLHDQPAVSDWFDERGIPR